MLILVCEQLYCSNKGGDFMGVGKTIKKIIKEKGLKQIYVAEKAGISISQFNNILNERNTINDVQIERVIKVLEITPNELFQTD